MSMVKELKKKLLDGGQIAKEQILEMEEEADG